MLINSFDIYGSAHNSHQTRTQRNRRECFRPRSISRRLCYRHSFGSLFNNIRARNVLGHACFAAAQRLKEKHELGDN